MTRVRDVSQYDPTPFYPLPNLQTHILKFKKNLDIYCKNECPRDRKNSQGLGFVKIDLIASSTLVIVRAGLQLSFKMSIIKLPAVSTLQW